MKRSLVIPLNGTETHPLSAHAIDKLWIIASGPTAAQEFNPGVINRLQRGNGAEPYVEIVRLPSPYASHKKGQNTNFVKIMEAGRAFLRRIDADRLHRIDNHG